MPRGKLPAYSAVSERALAVDWLLVNITSSVRSKDASQPLGCSSTLRQRNAPKPNGACLSARIPALSPMLCGLCTPLSALGLCGTQFCRHSSDISCCSFRLVNPELPLTPHGCLPSCFYTHSSMAEPLAYSLSLSSACSRGIWMKMTASLLPNRCLINGTMLDFYCLIQPLGN